MVPMGLEMGLEGMEIRRRIAKVPPYFYGQLQYGEEFSRPAEIRSCSKSSAGSFVKSDGKDPKEIKRLWERKKTPKS